MTEREQILSKLSSSVPAIVDEEKEDIVKVELPLQVSDIDDIISKGSGKLLSNLDYQILVTLSNGFKSEETIAEEYQVSKNYIKKLIRSPDGSEFLQEQAKQKADLSLSMTTNMVNNGLVVYQEYLQDLFAKGRTTEALYHLFGKQSIVEVQNMLHKQQANVVEDNDNGLMNLFKTISVGASK